MKRNLNFDKHREEEHNHWDYFYYLIYLNQKSLLEFNGFESYVYGKYISGEISWFPIGEAMIMGGESAEEVVEDKLEIIDRKLEKIIQKFKGDDLENGDAEDNLREAE